MRARLCLCRFAVAVKRGAKVGTWARLVSVAMHMPKAKILIPTHISASRSLRARAVEGKLTFRDRCGGCVNGSPYRDSTTPVTVRCSLTADYDISVLINLIRSAGLQIGRRRRRAVEDAGDEFAFNPRAIVRIFCLRFVRSATSRYTVDGAFLAERWLGRWP